MLTSRIEGEPLPLKQKLTDAMNPGRFFSHIETGNTPQLATIIRADGVNQ